GAILDDEARGEVTAQPIGDQAGRDIERAARRERHDEARRVRRPGRLCPCRNACQPVRERRENKSSAPHWPVTLPPPQRSTRTLIVAVDSRLSLPLRQRSRQHY